MCDCDSDGFYLYTHLDIQVEPPCRLWSCEEWNVLRSGSWLIEEKISSLPICGIFHAVQV